MIKAFGQIASYLKHYKIDIIIIILSLTNVSICMLALGRILQHLIDQALAPENIMATHWNMMLMSVLILLFSVSSFFRSYFINSLAERVTSKIRLKIYEKTLNLDLVKLEELKTGDLIAKFGADLDLVSSLVTNFLSFALRNSIMFCGALILMFTQSVKLSAIILTIIPLCLMPILILGKCVRKLSAGTLDIKSSIYTNLIESFSNIRAIHAFRQEYNQFNRFRQKGNEYRKSNLIRLKVRSIFFAGTICLILLSVIFVIWVGMIDIMQGSISSGKMIAFIYYAIIVAFSAGGLAELFSDVQPAIIATEQIFNFINFTDKDNAKTVNTVKKLTTNISSIEVKNVTFSYPTRQEIKILNNISLKISLGQFIGIIGESGSGKSTLLQLLMGFYTIDSGIISIPPKVKIAYVSQDPMIFSGTIESNITFAKPKASKQDIMRVADITGITDFTNNLDKGPESEIGERGIKLSGGQKQRIAIARALLIKPDILLMDEATSALDSCSEAKILADIRKMMQGKIIISVAHRLSTIAGADEVFILSNGIIAEQGSHKQLLAKSLYYQYICREQQMTSVD